MLPHLTLLRDMGCAVVVYADTSRRNEGDIFRPLSGRPVLDTADKTLKNIDTQVTQVGLVVGDVRAVTRPL
ncbi:MAG: hypothetical protein J0H43_04420, partial [Actinobacteria bacterium]|nr:hypothetical protein [Actinomycetota bacterium]